MRKICALFLFPVVLCAAGCVELRQVLLDTIGADSTQGVTGQPGSAGDPFDGSENGSTDATADNGAPRVQLRLLSSNAYPGLHEQVDLRCSVIDSNSSVGVTFAFQGLDRLAVDEVRGTAFFIVAEEDLGIEMRLTCTGTNETGMGSASNNVSIIPTSAVDIPDNPLDDALPGDGQTENGQTEDDLDLP